MLFTLRRSSEDAIATLDDLMIRARRLVDALQYGGHTRRKSGSGENFWQFRDYEAGSDRPQDIDWRQSAKGSHIYVREKELQTAQDYYFWVDKNAGMDFCSDQVSLSKLGNAQILAMSMALLLAGSGEKIGLIGTDIRGHSESALENFGLHLLNDPAVENFDVRSKSTLFMLGDFIAPLDEIEARLSSMAERVSRGALIQTLDPAELDLPYQGRVVFEGKLLGQDDFEAQNAGALRAEYIKRIADHCAALEALCHQYGFLYFQHRSDMEARDTLRALLLALDEGDA